MSQEITPGSSATPPHEVTHIGHYLKSRREELKLSLEKVSQKTKINLNILRALEANDFANLPSAAYVKGFVLSYSRVIGLTPNDVVTKLEYSYLTLVGKPFPALNHTRQFMPGDPTPAPNEASQPVPSPATAQVDGSTQEPSEVLDQDRRAQRRQRVVVPAVVFTGIIVIFVGLYQVITRTIEGESNQREEKPYGNTFVPSSELVEIHKPMTPAPVTTEAKKEEPKPATVEEKKEEEKKPVETNVRRNFPPKDFRKITVRLFSVVPDAPENQDEKILPTKIRDGFNKEMENIYVTAIGGNTWLSYKVDNGPIVSAIIEKGKDLFIQGKEILIFLGNVNVTKIFYQNRLIDPPTKTGFKSLVFPESAASKHQLPLFPKASDDILYTAEEYQRRMKIEEDELRAKGLIQ